MSTATDSQPVLLDIDTSGIATLTLNRPQQFNTIDIASMQCLANLLADIDADSRVRAVILRGDGKTFSGGGDIRSMHEHLDELPRFIGEIVDRFHAAIIALRRLKVPVIASVHGSAAGGGFSLALACDLVVATQSARFVIAYPKLATSTDGGLSFFLTRRLGTARALDILLLRNEIGAVEAQALGLVNRLADDDQLAAQTLALAEQLAALPVQSVREIKSLVAGLGDADLHEQLAAERAAFMRCSAEPELGARLSAFLTKKK
jgi:2-(1,2-epoxy-1,2-dihydrophenyl)acetyl-CoA isomerase